LDEIVKEVLAEALEIDIEEVGMDLDLEEIETWDSIAVVSCLAEFDDQFDIILDGQKLSDCKTPSEIIKLLEENG
jgi:acyl carrier protein